MSKLSSLFIYCALSEKDLNIGIYLNTISFKTLLSFNAGDSMYLINVTKNKSLIIDAF